MLLERDRILADTHARGIVNGVGDGWRDPGQAELADTLRP